MVNKNNGSGRKGEKFSKLHCHKHNGGAGRKAQSGQKDFANTKDMKKERAKKFQERQALRAEKQKELVDVRARAKQEKEEKIRQYKKKRLEKTKAISKRTQRGQPLMNGRMQLLLTQIQEIKRNER